ncbi:uncharacterized protein [Anabrus simplex]|uniref:uncharacterized protein isoform X1 n=1 Tax=Anabrus simplex TaxID=316456 RepID=UPI0034DDBCD1
MVTMSLHSLYITIALLLILLSSCVHGVKDGFNLYKDLLRGKNEESGDNKDVQAEESSPRFFYFHRLLPAYTSSNDGYVPLSRSGMSADYLVSKDMLEGTVDVNNINQIKDDSSPRLALPRTAVKRLNNLFKGGSTMTLTKRGPGSILSWALATNHPIVHTDLRQGELTLK